MVVAVAAVASVIAYVDSLSNAFDKAADNAANSVSAYNEAKDAVASIEDQLQNVKDKIAEINSYEKLTITDQEDLANLKLEQKILERQLELAKEREEVARRQAVRDTVAALLTENTHLGATTNANGGFGGLLYAQSTEMDELEEKQRNLNTLIEERNSLLIDEQGNLIPINDLTEEQRYKYDAISASIDNIKSEILDSQESLLILYNTLNENKDLLSEYGLDQGFLDQLGELLGIGESIGNLRDQLRSMKPDDISFGWGDWYNFVNDLSDQEVELLLRTDTTNWKPEQYADWLNEIRGGAEEATDAIDSMTAAYNKFTEAQSAANERDPYANIGKSYDSIKDLLDQGWVNDDEVNKYLDFLIEADQRTNDNYDDFEKLTQKIGDTDFSIMDFFQYDEDNNLVSDGLYNFLDTVHEVMGDEYVQKLEDGSYSFDFGDVGTEKFDALCDALGLSEDAVRMLEHAMMDAGFDIDFRTSEEKMAVLQSEATETKNALVAMGGEAYNVNIDTNGVDTAEEKVAILQGAIDSLSSLDVNADSEAAEYVNTLIANCKAQIDLINSTPITPAVDSSESDAYESANHDIPAEVLYSANYSNVLRTPAPNRNAYIYYTPIYAGNTSSLLGIGRASGTAHNRGTAFARGSWGVDSSGVGLGGELGQELVVRNGKYFTIGDNSAEFFNFKKNDIVFNAAQTAAIFKYGKIPNGNSRGLALASGTAFDTGSGNGRRYTSTYTSSSTTSAAGRSSGSSSGSSSSSSSRSSTSSSTSSTSSTSDDTEVIDWIEIALSRIEAAIDRLATRANSTFKVLKTRLGATYDEIAEITDELEFQTRAQQRYLEEANSVGLSAGLAEDVRNGAVDITLYDSDTAEKIKLYQQWYEKAVECSDAIQDLHESLASLYKDNFDNVQKDFENKLDIIEHTINAYESGNDLIEARGYTASTEFYSAIQAAEQQSISTLENELDTLTAYMKEAVASGEIEEGSEAWYDMQSAINSVKESIAETTISVAELDNTIRKIHWDRFDYLQDRISQVTQESEFLISLLESSDMYKNNGQLSSQGMATAGLRAVDYNVYLNQSKQYADEIKNIDEELAKNPYNIELVARREDLLKLQQQSILAAEKEKKAIQDLVEGGIQKELSSLKELISSYTDSLSAAKDLYSYQNNISDKASKISSLEKQLSAYDNDLSEETRARVQKLRVELSDAREDLRDTEYDQYVSDQKKLLDDLYSEYETILNQRMDNTDVLMSDMIDKINENSSSINDTLEEQAAIVGYSISDSMSAIWSKDNENNVVAKYGKDIASQLTSVNTSLATIGSYVSSLVSASNTEVETAKQEVDRTAGEVATANTGMGSNTDTAANRAMDTVAEKTGKWRGSYSKGWWYQYTDGTYAQNEWKTIDGKTYHFDKKGWMDTGWLKDNGDWYYLSSSGAMQTGWIKLKGTWYYLDEDGKMVTGTQKINGKSYTFNNSGAWLGYASGTKNAKAGLHRINENGAEYIFDSNGNQYRMFSGGEKVLNAKATDFLYDFATSAGGSLITDLKGINQLSLISSGPKASYVGVKHWNPNSAMSMADYSSSVGATAQNGDIYVNIAIDRVMDYNDFITQLQNDSKAERMIQAMTVDKLSGGSSLAKHKFTFKQ